MKMEQVIYLGPYYKCYFKYKKVKVPIYGCKNKKCKDKGTNNGTADIYYCVYCGQKNQVVKENEELVPSVPECSSKLEDVCLVIDKEENCNGYRVYVSKDYLNGRPLCFAPEDEEKIIVHCMSSCEYNSEKEKLEFAENTKKDLIKLNKNYDEVKTHYGFLIFRD